TMARILIDWSQEESLDLPAGRYLFKVVEAREGESSSGYPQVSLKLMVVAPKKHKGRHQWAYLTLAPKALRFARIALEALLGKKMPKAAAELDLDSLIGKMAYAEVVKTVRGDNEYTNVTNWERYSSVEDDDDEDVDDTAANDDLDDDDEDDDDLPWDDDDEDEDEDEDDDELPWDDDDDEDDEEP